MDSELLANLELDLCDPELALSVVNSDISVSCLIRVEDIFAELNGQLTLALAAAAHCSQGYDLSIDIATFELDRRLLNHQPLLVFQDGVVMHVQNCLDGVFDLYPRLIVVVSVLKKN